MKKKIIIVVAILIAAILLAIADSPESLHMLTANSANIAIPVIFNIIFKNSPFIPALSDIVFIKLTISPIFCKEIANINIPDIIDI